MGLEYNALSVAPSSLGLIDHRLTVVAVVSRSLGISLENQSRQGSRLYIAGGCITRKHPGFLFHI